MYLNAKNKLHTHTHTHIYIYIHRTHTYVLQSILQILLQKKTTAIKYGFQNIKKQQIYNMVIYVLLVY